MDIKDKVAFITGGASSLREATVCHFAKLSAKVALFDMSKQRAQEITDKIAMTAQYMVKNGYVTAERIRVGSGIRMQAR